VLRRLFIIADLAFAFAVAQPPLATAQGKSEAGQGKVPLSQIVRNIQQREGGEAASIKFENGTYRILWRDAQGNLKRFEADARTGRTRKRN